MKAQISPALVPLSFGTAALVLLAALGASCAEAPDRPIVMGNDIDASPNQDFTSDGDDAAAPPATDAGMCNAYECPAPYATCAGVSGLCTTNLTNDFEHCGSCDNVCPTPARGLAASFLCSAGRCEMVCTEGNANCNGYVDDGCETSLNYDPENCGACGITCAPGQLCWQGGCGCPKGTTECNGECVRLATDGSNCGACGQVCNGSNATGPDVWPCGEGVLVPGMDLGCQNSQCGQHCAAGYADCNSDKCGDGCETNTQDDSKNCGACGHECAPEQICVSGKCICDPGTTRCGSTCTDLQSDPDNCGACGNVCPGLNEHQNTARGEPICVLGQCSYQCAVGYADCDNRLENGCEVDLMTDPRHCGNCGTQCDLAGGQPCGAGQCLTKPCDAGPVH